jgi:adenine-specific DNA-methyltransferase
MIKYLGSKRLLVPHLVDAAEQLVGRGTCLDLFSGTARVGRGLKAAGQAVVANDHNAYAATAARCYVGADRRSVEVEARHHLEQMQALPAQPGHFTATWCEAARYIHPDNGGRIEAMRAYIDEQDLGADLRAVLLTALIEAADRVDSTTGVQMAYLKSWAKRALKPIELRVPELLDGVGTVFEMEASDAARAAGSVDLAYLDPPYNQHSYLGNYHLWESLVRWDAPEVYGVAAKRTDVQQRKSPFNSKPGIAPALRQVLDNLDAKTLIVSFSNEGFLSQEALEEMLAPRGAMAVLAVDYKRYVGAQIGIHNPAGERVGAVGSLRNKELLFIVGPDATAVDRAAAQVAARAIDKKGRRPQILRKARIDTARAAS